MTEVFTAYEYLRYLGKHWRIPVAAGAVALLTSLGISLLLPKRYTASSSIMIDPPGASDPRLSMGISAIYLESLKSYERLASSDTLFEDVVKHFHLQSDVRHEPIEALKKRTLKVTKVRDTRILEISVTASDPVVAHQAAQYLAEETVRVSREGNLAADSDLSRVLAHQLEEARDHLTVAKKDQTEDLRSEPVEALRGETDTVLELLTTAQQTLASTSADVAEWEQRAKWASSQSADPAQDRTGIQSQLQASNARASSLRKQIADLRLEYERKSSLMSVRAARQQQIQDELDVAQAAYTATLARVNEQEAQSGSRGERLRVVDPGVVPQRPSAPNIPLNLIAAFVLALVGAGVFTAIGFARYLNSPRRFRERLLSGS